MNSLTQVESATVVFHITAIVGLLGCLAYRLKMAFTVKASIENVGFSILLTIFASVMACELVNVLSPAFTRLYSQYWRIASLVCSLFYLLIQICVFSRFQRVLLYPIWVPGALAVFSIILHIGFCAPSYGAIVLFEWKNTNSFTKLYPIAGVWLVWVIVLDFLISLASMRVIMSSLDSYDPENRTILNQLKAMLVFMLLCDLTGVVLNAMASFNIYKESLVSQELGETAFQAVHVALGTIYFTRIIALFVRNTARNTKESQTPSDIISVQ